MKVGKRVATSNRENMDPKKPELMCILPSKNRQRKKGRLPKYTALSICFDLNTASVLSGAIYNVCRLKDNGSS